MGVVAARARRQVAALERAGGVAPGTDPVIAIAALRERVARLEAGATAAAADRAALVEALRLGVIGVDEGLRIVTANATAHGLMDRAPGSLVGRSLIEMFLDLQVEADRSLGVRRRTGDRRGGAGRARTGRGSSSTPIGRPVAGSG